MSFVRFPAFLLAFFFLSSCERPSSPDFELQQSMEVPLIQSMTYKFLGSGSGMVIDTTSEDYEDIFDVEQAGPNRGLVSISSEIDFEIGSFDDITPTVDISSTEVETEIGLIDVDDFSSEFESEIGLIESEGERIDDEIAEVGVFEAEFEGSGSSDFTEITGISPRPPAGTDIDAGHSEVDILLEVGDFQEATVDEGAIRFIFENDLGLNLSSVEARLLSGYAAGDGMVVGSTIDVQGGVDHGETVDEVIVFETGEELSVELALRVTVQFEDQELKAAEDYRLKVTAADEAFKVSRAIASVTAQSLDPETDPLSIENEKFVYAIVTDDPDEGPFELTVRLQNNTNLPVTSADRNTLPGIIIYNDEGEALGNAGFTRFVLEGSANPGQIDPPAPGEDQGETGVAVINLDGQTITRNLTYELDIGTAGSDGSAVVVDENQNFKIASATNELKLVEAVSDVEEQEDILLEDTKEVDGDFINAQVDTGTMDLTFRNESELDMFIEELIFTNATDFVAKNTGRYFADGSEIGRVHEVTIPAGQVADVAMPLDNVGISDLITFEGTASSPGTGPGDDPVEIRAADLIITEMEGSVQLNSAESVLDPQEFTSHGEVDISDEDFKLHTMDHYVEVFSGMLNIGDFVNQIDMDIDTLTISFPNIRMNRNGNGSYAESDSLWVQFVGDDRVLRTSDADMGQPEKRVSLENARIYAPGNKLEYNVFAITENTRNHPADSIRSVRSDDMFTAQVDIDDLEIRTALGDIQQRVELLNDDFDGDGNLDLFNDEEAEISEFDDLEAISDVISDIQLSNSGFDLVYETNLGVEGTVIAAIVGINDDNERVYLSGLPGTERYVDPNVDDVGNLYADEAPVDPENLVKFKITPAQNIGEVIRNQVAEFNTENSNVDDFFSNMPTEIRFVGKVIINPDAEEGYIVDPVAFNTHMGVDIPINLSTPDRPASIEDTLSSDLSDLPKPDDDLRLSEMMLHINYENGLPFTTEFELLFLDEFDQIVEVVEGVPVMVEKFGIEAGQVDEDSRFVTLPHIGSTEIRVSGDNLDNLYRARKIKLSGQLNTDERDGSSEVKLRADDYVTLSVTASFETTIRVN